MVVSDVTVDGLVTGPPLEKRVVPIHGRCRSSQVPSLAELRLSVEQLVKKPPSLGEIRLYPRVRCTEEIEEDEVFDCRELSWRGIAEQTALRVGVDVARRPLLCKVP